MNLELFFSEDAILNLLCKYRASAANKRHKKHMIRNVSLHSKSNNISVKDDDYEFKLLQSFFPGRRNWCQINNLQRKEIKDSTKVNQLRLLNTCKSIKWEIRHNSIPPPTWYSNLLNFIEEIKNEVVNIEFSSYKIDRPEIRGIKKGLKGETLIYRPIAIYDLKNKIICCQTSKYLTKYFDNIFLDCSYAFRAKRIGVELPTHHNCIEEILKYRKEHRDVWVAECDIQKFFDSVQQEQATNIFNNLSEEVENTTGIKIDFRAAKIFKIFLDSFDFQKDIFNNNDDEQWFKEKKIEKGEFSWIKNELNQEYGSDYTDNYLIGVPQGNAISCFISNLVLHSVDKYLKDNFPDVFYIRYCDDMILMATDEKKCNQALEAYMKEINANFLLYHTPKDFSDYTTKKGSEEFWKLKSKKPFYWGNKHLDNKYIPWVSFVGYQMNFAGQIRVRKATVEKETKKQVAETQKVLKYLGKINHYNSVNNIHSRISKSQIKFSLHNRLVSMSVGRFKLHNLHTEKDRGLCWTNGFRGLQNNKITSRQLKYLDRRRNIQIRRLQNEIYRITKPHHQRSLVSNKNKIFFGTPFSYYHYLKNK